MAQIQIPNFEGHNQQYARDQQNALVQRSHMKTEALQQNALGMRNQDMAKEQADRAELEQLLMTTPPEQRERAGLEFLKQRDPEKALKLQAQYFHEFVEKGKVDPTTAAAELERKTGEKIKVGSRYAQIETTDGIPQYRDMLTGQVLPPTAQTLAAIQHDYRKKEEDQKQENRVKLAGVNAALKPEKTDTTVTPFEEWKKQNPNAPIGEYFKLSSQARPQMGMGQFAGIQDGEAVIFRPSRGGGSLGTLPLPGQGPIQPKTEPADVRTQRLGFAKADPVLNSIAELSERINVNQGIAAKAIGEVEKAKAKANLNDDVAEYESLLSGFTPLVARAVGHTGVLTEQDVQSVRKLFPAPGDSKSLRDRKMARLKTIIGGVREAIGSKSPAAPAGTFDADKEARYQEWKRKQLGQ